MKAEANNYILSNLSLLPIYISIVIKLPFIPNVPPYFNNCYHQRGHFEGAFRRPNYYDKWILEKMLKAFKLIFHELRNTVLQHCIKQLANICV